MSIRDIQKRAFQFWLGNEKKKSPLSGPLKKVMLRAGNGKKCPICSVNMEYYYGMKIDHTTPNAATIEHILPRSLGGGHHPENLTVICKCCNLARGLVFNDLNLCQSSLNRYVEWLFDQLTDPYESSKKFPDEFQLFSKHWIAICDREYQIPNRKNQQKKKGKLDMSANARKKSMQGGQ